MRVYSGLAYLSFAISSFICLAFGTSSYAQNCPSEEHLSEIIVRYLKSTDEEEIAGLKIKLSEVKELPSLNTLSKIIGKTVNYPKLAPLKRITRKIKVGGIEFSYELSPPGSYAPNKETPLVISLHGQGGDGAGALRYWRIPPEDMNMVREQAVRLMKTAGQNLPPNIKISAPIGTNDYLIAAPTLTGQHTGGVNPATLEELIPVMLTDIMSVCNVDTNRIYLSGFSLGGHLTWYESALHPDYFAGAMPVAGACRNRTVLENFLNLPVYIIHGERDQVVTVEAARQADKALTGLKYDVTYREIKGLEHSWPATSSGENTKLLAWMKSKTRNPFPKKIIYRPQGFQPVRIYWLELTQLSRTAAGRARLEADVEENRINIKAEGVDKLTILLSPELADFNKEVTIVVNGKEKFKGIVTQSLLFLLEDFRKHQDLKRLFTAKIEIMGTSKN